MTPARAAEDPPAVVAGLYDALRGIMAAGGTLDYAGRCRQLEPVIGQSFDLALMTRIAVGRDWPSLGPEIQARLLDSFRRFTIGSYAAQFAADDGEIFRILGQREEGEDRVVVESVLVPAGGTPIRLDYALHRAGPDWRIVDVYLTGTISELSRRRSEFSTILDREGVAGLIAALDLKAKGLK